MSVSCKVMGIVNVTPDSFSDGGMYFSPEEAVRRARNLADDGADIIDIGGESTRPGAIPIGWEEEWNRIEPVVGALAGEAVISVDTYHPETARRAIEAGAKIVNCVYPEPVSEMVRLMDSGDMELVIPVKARGVVPTELMARVYLDPMIGFGTTREEDIAIIRSIPDLARQGRVLIGASRKRIVKRLTGAKMAGRDIGGNVAIAVWAALSGASAVRVHDVRETAQAIRVLEQI